MSKRPTTIEDKYALVGIAIGMGVAAVVAIVFAYDASSMVRYVIMATGLVAGWLIGRSLGRKRMGSS